MQRFKPLKTRGSYLIEIFLDRMDETGTPEIQLVGEPRTRHVGDPVIIKIAFVSCCGGDEPVISPKGLTLKIPTR